MSGSIGQKKAALILGGSSGIGACIAEALSDKFKGKKIFIADCNEPGIKNENFEYININLAYQRLDILKDLDIDTLIITAGIGRLSRFETFAIEEIKKNFLVNTFPAIELISSYYKKLNSEQDFNCCVLSSIAGIVASPLYSVYSATKAALVKFIEAINAELAYAKVKNRILNVAPGRIEGTNFHGKSESSANSAFLEDLSVQVIEKMLRKDELFIPKFDETYSRVIKEYQQDGSQFAQKSMEYKLKNNITNDVPQLTVGYLTGTFDLFHIGHLNLLKNAKKHCDKLIVGVHPDAKHKKKEVFIPLEERMEILRNISIVDEVIVCSDEDVDDYETLQYNCLFVGSDYQGSDRFNRYEEYFSDKNVKIIYLPYTTTTSSTQLRSAITTQFDK